MRNATRSGILVALVLGLVGAVVVGCTQWSSLVPDRVNSNEDTQIASASANRNISEIIPAADEVASCGLSQLTGDERAQAIQEALSNPKVQDLVKELSSRGYNVFSSAASAYAMDGEKLVWLPAGISAGIMYQTYLGKGYATGAINDGERTINIRPDSSVRHIFGFDPKTKDKFFKQARNNKQLKALDKTLKAKDQRIEWSQSVLFVDSEGNTVTIGLAVKGINNSKPARFAYRVEANLKGRKLVVQRVKLEICGNMALGEIGSLRSDMKENKDVDAISDSRQYTVPTCIPENDLTVAVPNVVCGATTTTSSPTVTITGTTVCSSGAGTTCIDILYDPASRRAILANLRSLMRAQGLVPSLILPQEGLFTYGFEDLSPEQLEALLSAWKAYQTLFGITTVTPPSTQISIDHVINALKELKPYLSASNFVQMVDQMKQKYPGFGLFVPYLSTSADSQLQQVRQIVTNMSVDPVVEQLTIR